MVCHLSIKAQDHSSLSENVRVLLEGHLGCVDGPQRWSKVSFLLWWLLLYNPTLTPGRRSELSPIIQLLAVLGLSIVFCHAHMRGGGFAMSGNWPLYMPGAVLWDISPKGAIAGIPMSSWALPKATSGCRGYISACMVLPSKMTMF